jgi:hypothetical protein
MINPKTLVGEWVTALRSLPNLVQALGGNANSIQGYSENAVVFGQAAQNNIRLALLSMPPGSIMITWDGDRTGRLGAALMFVHDFRIYMRAPESAAIGYEDIWYLIVTDIPQGTALAMLHSPIDPYCEPMDFYLPTASRNTVVVGADGATFEYFEVRASLIESLNP